MRETGAENIVYEDSSLPPRSRLYHLTPIGIGTAYVESLTSYLVRLAYAYQIGTRTLILQEVFPIIQETRKLKQQNLAAWFGSSTGINGMSPLVKDWVQAVEQLTLYNDLSFLTMLPWSNVINRYISMTRKTRVWCPLCYNEWLQTGSVVYDPLIWNIYLVEECPRHHIPLHNQCPHCQQHLLLLPRLSHPACCPNCKHFLIASSNEGIVQKSSTIKGREQYQWILHSIGEMLAIAPHLLTWPSREKIAYGITKYIEQSANEILESIPRSLRIDGPKLRGYQGGSHLPEFETFLLLCYYMRISPICFLTEDIYKISPTSW